MSDLATLVTPAHSRDLERFIFQQESIERCGIEIPQVVIVNEEEVDVFRAVPSRRGLTILSTRDVLSPQIEDRRRAGRYQRRNPTRWWLGRHGGTIHGWTLQQIIKLSSPKVVDTPIIVCMDTDTFFVGPVSDSDFVGPDGRTHLYETTDDLDAEMAEWPAHSMRFLGLHPVGRKLVRYTHSPVVLHREVVVDLQKHIAQLHGRPWDGVVADADRVMEYTTYGVYAREIDQLKRVIPVAPPLSSYFWWREEVARIECEFANRVRETGARIVGVQSNSGCPVATIRPLAEPLWKLRPST